MIIMQQNTRTFATRQNLSFSDSLQNLQEADLQERLYFKGQQQNGESRFPQKCRKNWSRSQRKQYASTLEAFQDSQIAKAEVFYDHLSELLGRSPQQVRAYHHKMMSEYVSARRVVTSILGKRSARNSRNYSQKTAIIEDNALLSNYEKENIYVQNFSSNQHVAFAESSIALTSLDQYEESSEQIQIFQLEEEDFIDNDDDDQNIKNYQDWSTNGSEGRPSSEYVQMAELLQE